MPSKPDSQAVPGLGIAVLLTTVRRELGIGWGAVFPWKAALRPLAVAAIAPRLPELEARRRLRLGIAVAYLLLQQLQPPPPPLPKILCCWQT